MSSQNYIDISPEISVDIAVFEGDVPFSRDVMLDMKKGHHMTLSSIKTTLHLGAHADGPNHYDKTGVSIAQRNLGVYRGLAQVIRIPLGPRERLTPAHLKSHVIRAPRLLFDTGTFRDPNKWHDQFAALSPELIQWLHQNHQVKLVGLDTPSVDLSDSKELETHRAIAACDMAILEGLALASVPEGCYELVALPLRIRDADASPVRAVLYQWPPQPLE